MERNRFRIALPSPRIENNNNNNRTATWASFFGNNNTDNNNNNNNNNTAFRSVQDYPLGWFLSDRVAARRDEMLAIRRIALLPDLVTITMQEILKTVLSVRPPLLLQCFAILSSPVPVDMQRVLKPAVHPTLTRGCLEVLDILSSLVPVAMQRKLENPVRPTTSNAFAVQGSILSASLCSNLDQILGAPIRPSAFVRPTQTKVISTGRG